MNEERNYFKFNTGIVKVVNISSSAPKVAMPRQGVKLIMCDRTTILGNPWHVTEDMRRFEVINKYAKYLPKNERAMRIVRQIAKYVKSGNDVDLGCWCAPSPCHCDVIKKTIIEEIKKL